MTSVRLDLRGIRRRFGRLCRNDPIRHAQRRAVQEVEPRARGAERDLAEDSRRDESPPARGPGVANDRAVEIESALRIARIGEAERDFLVQDQGVYPCRVEVKASPDPQPGTEDELMLSGRVVEAP